MPVQTVNKRLDRRLVQVADVARRLARLLAHHLFECSVSLHVKFERKRQLTIICGLMSRKASMTTLPLTDWMGSMTMETARGLSCSKDC
jgi:hypothetical protein